MVEFGYMTPTGERIYVKLESEETLGILGYLARRLAYIKDFVMRPFRHEKLTLTAPVEIGTLRAKLTSSKILSEPQLVTVEGAFVASLLLTSGWWERREKAKARQLSWREPLQEWLYRGFEEWGPSWNISMSPDRRANDYLFGQLGVIDEVNSLPVIVQGEKATNIRENILGDLIVFEAEVTGLLCHRSHLSTLELKGLGHWGKTFDYCIIVLEGDKQHIVSRRLEKAQAPYSGYLWQCLAPVSWLTEKKPPRLDEVYLIWEHTDFTKPDAIAFNLDGLQHKADYLRGRHGNLILLQKSMPLVPGEPHCPTDQFYKLVTSLR